MIASQALVNVLGASRYSTFVDEVRELASGRFGRTPGPIDPALARAVELLGDHTVAPADFEAIREEAKGLAASEEELLLLALLCFLLEGWIASPMPRENAADAPVASAS